MASSKTVSETERPKAERPKAERPKIARRKTGPNAGRKLTGKMEESARHLYETTSTSVAIIARFAGVGLSTLNRYRVEGGWTRGASAPTSDGRGIVCPGMALCPVRTALHRRLYASLESRLEETERRQADAKAAEADIGAADREREVRSLASLTRTLDKLRTMDGAMAALLAPAPSPVEIAPYDVEALRRELSDRLDRLRRARGKGEIPH